ncbi:MAG: hypothetical protein UR89_C0031G0004 [Candidatus Roizmanbacteria bacterium GW2011_GWA2_35_8]|uniref:Uncharacterized protein n=1 Tax=Candidatus Roizmanbacteria bacterium GW2011_GWA2_35_8 TaxID=1618479 RepID=A0A0G0DC16_9BACT|nr:MAG: hypothetical protein UR89_C0031G0004 [Candidatus Roizmanbacteria bacterium GW2011_GWA2_35_8]
MPLKSIVKARNPELPSMAITTPFIDSERFRKCYNIPDNIRVDGVQFESDSLTLNHPLIDQLTQLGIQTIKSYLIKPISIKLVEFFEGGELSLHRKTKGLFKADLQFDAKPDLKITYHTNSQKKKNINETMAELALIASVPFELLEEIKEKKLKATLIRQVNEDNEAFINYDYGICQLQVTWDEKTSRFIATEPDIPGNGGSYKDEVDARRIAAEKTDLIFFLATRRREEKRIRLT